MRAKNRAKNRAGFTLAETLLAVLILLLVSGIVATGIPAAKTAYENVVLASNADALLSTAAATLRDELGTAWKVRNVAAGGVTYFSADTGYRSSLYVQDGKIRLKEYSEVSEAEKILNIKKDPENDRELVFQAASDTALKVTCDGIMLDAESKAVKVSNLRVTNREGKPLAEEGNLVIPVFSIDDTDTTDSTNPASGG